MPTPSRAAPATTWRYAVAEDTRGPSEPRRYAPLAARPTPVRFAANAGKPSTPRPSITWRPSQSPSSSSSSRSPGDPENQMARGTFSASPTPPRTPDAMSMPRPSRTRILGSLGLGARASEGLDARAGPSAPFRARAWTEAMLLGGTAAASTQLAAKSTDGLTSIDDGSPRTRAFGSTSAGGSIGSTRSMSHVVTAGADPSPTQPRHRTRPPCCPCVRLRLRRTVSS